MRQIWSQGSNYTKATEVMTCPFGGLALVPLDHCQSSSYFLPLVSLGVLLLFCQVASVSPKNKTPNSRPNWQALLVI